MTKEPEQVDRDYLAPGVASKAAFVSSKTLGRLADEGAIRAIKLPSGHRRYSAEDIERLKNGTLTVTKVYPATRQASA